MAMWNPWRGCHKYSEGCKFCYIHKGDAKRNVDTNKIIKTDKFYAPIEKNKKGEYKMKSGQIVYLCFSTDFFIKEADACPLTKTISIAWGRRSSSSLESCCCSG